MAMAKVMTINVRRDNDPFKKYWWIILVGFAMVAAWICMPLMDSGIGEGSVSKGEDGLKGSVQNLDSVDNPNGAPGSPTDMSMEGGSYRRKKSSGGMTSSLYQAPPETAAPGAPAALASVEAPAASANLADALKGVSKKVDDASGWGGVKAQKGFEAPKGRFGGLSGLGSSGGGGSGGFMAASSGFGAATPNTGVTTTRGLPSSSERPKPRVGGNQGMAALQSAAAGAGAAAMAKSADAAAGGVGRSFDGNKSGASLSDTTSKGGVYGALDTTAAPINLKANPADLSKREIKAPPAKKAENPDGKAAAEDEDMSKMVMKMLIQAVIGGITAPISSSISDFLKPGSAADEANRKANTELDAGSKSRLKNFDTCGKATCP